MKDFLGWWVASLLLRHKLCGTFMCMNEWMCVWTCVRMCVHMNYVMKEYVWVCMYMCVGVCVCECVHVCLSMYVHVCVCVGCMFVSVRIYDCDYKLRSVSLSFFFFHSRNLTLTSKQNLDFFCPVLINLASVWGAWCTWTKADKCLSRQMWTVAGPSLLLPLGLSRHHCVWNEWRKEGSLAEHVGYTCKSVGDTAFSWDSFQWNSSPLLEMTKAI